MAVSTIVMWRWTGFNALIYLAGMQSIDNQLYEAAAMDGASRWKQFLYVTLPGLRPTILFTIVVSTIGAAQLFGEPLLYDPTGQPNGGGSNQYQTLGLLMYQQGWTNDRLGLASATAWTMFVIIMRGGAGQPAAHSSGGRGRSHDAPQRRARCRRARCVYLGVILLTVISCFPLYYTIVMASHTNAEMAAGTPPLLPNASLFDNLGKAFDLAPLNLGLINSLIVSGAITLGTVAFCTLAGFAFAKLHFRGRNALLGLCVGDDDGADADGRDPALHDDGQVGLGRAPALGHPPDAGHRVRRVLHAPVHRLVRSRTSCSTPVTSTAPTRCRCSCTSSYPLPGRPWRCSPC